MNVELVDNVTATIVLGETLPARPRWQLTDLYVDVGPYDSMSTREQHLLDTIGSADWLWSGDDDIRFQQTSLLLASVRFRIPEKNGRLPSTFAEWLLIPPQRGLLQLNQAQSFSKTPAVVRWFEPNAEALVCLDQESMEPQLEKLRLRVTEDVDLLFVSNQLYGWLLNQPAKYLTANWQPPTLETYDKQLAGLLAQYFELVAEPNIERMENQDVYVLADLRTFYMQLTSQSYISRERSILRASIENIVESFYQRAINEDELI